MRFAVNTFINKGILQTASPWKLDGETYDLQSPPDNVSCTPGTLAGRILHQLTATIAFGPHLSRTHSSHPLSGTWI